MANRVVWTFLAQDKFSSTARQIKQSVAGVKEEFKKLSASTKSASKNLKSVGNSLRGVSIAATGAVIGSLKVFSDMEQGITNVLTLMDDKQIKEFGGAITDLATNSLTKFGFTTEDTTQALFDTISALGASKETLVSFEAGQKLAIGGASNLSAATLGVARIMNAYADQMLNAEDVANGFFAAQKGGTTNVEKMASSIGKVAKVASGAGIDFRVLLATTAELTNSFSTEESMTSFKALVNAITSATGDSAKVLKHYGVATTVSKLESDGFINTLRKLSHISDVNKDHLKLAIPSIEAYNAAMALNSSSIDKIVASIERMNQDQLSPAFAQQMKTFTRSTMLLKGNLVQIGIVIGSQLAPIFLKFSEYVLKAVEYFNGFSGATKKWIAIGVVIVAVLAPIILAISALVALISFIAPALVVIVAVAAAFGYWSVVVYALSKAIDFLIEKFNAMIGKFKAGYAAAKSFIGLGGDELNVNSSSDISRSNKSQIDVNLNAPKYVIRSVKSKTTGDKTGLNLGINMVGAY